MIPNQWYAIYESRHLRSRPVAVKRLGRALVLWRDGAGAAVCMEDRCPHRGAALSLGRVVDGQIACRYHGFRYNGEGACARMPCAGPDARIPKAMQVETHRVVERCGVVFMWWGEVPQVWPEPPWIDDVPRDPALCRTRSEIWPFNYVRNIENQLDSHHWAFVHGSIMLTPGERIDDQEVQVADDLVSFKGTLRRPGVDASGPGWPFHLKVKMPNATVVIVTPRFNSITFFTPIDEFSSWVMLRVNQRYTRVPVLRQLLDGYCMLFMFAMTNYRQDFPVLSSLRPRTSGPGASRLVKADQGIAAYLRLRERMIDTALHPEASADTVAGAARAAGYGFNWRRRASDCNDAPLRIEQRRELGIDANDSQAASALPREPLLSARERQASVGLERGWALLMAWLQVLIPFPLLVPFWFIHKFIDRIDRA